MKMTFADAVKSGLQNFANFKGTATRTEFWYFYLFTVLLNMVTTTLDSIIAPGMDFSGGLAAGAGPIYMITNLALVLPNLTIAVRRFHDAGLSGKWLFLWLLPIVVFFLTGGPSLASTPIPTENSSEAEILAVAGVVIPAFLTFAAVGLFQFVVNLLPSKPRTSASE